MYSCPGIWFHITITTCPDRQRKNLSSPRISVAFICAGTVWQTDLRTPKKTMCTSTEHVLFALRSCENCGQAQVLVLAVMSLESYPCSPVRVTSVWEHGGHVPEVVIRSALTPPLSSEGTSQTVGSHCLVFCMSRVPISGRRPTIQIEGFRVFPEFIQSLFSRFLSE